VELTRNGGERINRLSVDEARKLAVRLLAAASESQHTQAGDATRQYQMRQRDPDNDHRFDGAGTDGYEL
jgi:hypothetical protein